MVVRVNVSVPDSLKASMDEIEGINWSQVAQAAFAQAINERKAKEMNNVEAVAQRLRASGGAASVTYQRGFEAGKEWAAEEADLDDLETLVDLDIDELANRAEGKSETNREAVATLADWIASELGLLDDYTGSNNLFGGENLPTTMREVRGFVDGAAHVYQSVRGQI